MKYRFQALDSWRGFCALMVAAGHLQTSAHITHWGIVASSARFVDFFFVLSGFVIAYAYREQLTHTPGALRGFAIRRFGRLWPLHMFMLLGYIGFELAILAAGHAGINTGRPAFTDKDTLATLPGNIALIQAWGFFDGTTWNAPAWSISTEVFAYGCYAIAAVTVGRRAPIVMAVLAAVGLALIVSFAPKGMGSTTDYGLARCLYGFGGGVLVELLWRRSRHRTLPAATMLEVLACLLVYAVATLFDDPWAALIVPAAAILVYVFAFDAGAVSRVMRGRFPAWVGNRSYSIYMIHALIVQGIFAAALIADKMGTHLLGQRDGFTEGHVMLRGNPWVMDGVVLVYFAVVLGIAALTYRFVEMPGRDFFNRRAGTPRPPAPAGAP